MQTLEMLMRLGSQMIGQLLAEAGSDYQGTTVEKEGEQYRFEGNCQKVLHGLFGAVTYPRTYYRSDACRDGSYPLDEGLGIDKKHTPACIFCRCSRCGRATRKPGSFPRDISTGWNRPDLDVHGAGQGLRAGQAIRGEAATVRSSRSASDTAMWAALSPRIGFSPHMGGDEPAVCCVPRPP